MKTLVFDPAGNFVEGKGTTGYAVLNNDELTAVSELSARPFQSAAQYWYEHKLLIGYIKPDQVVCESYQLFHYKNRPAESQAFSYMETPQLIGAITVACFEKNLPLIFQTPAQVKRTWPDEKLVEEGYITKSGRSYFWNGKRLSNHMRDAIRHAIYYTRNRKRTAG